MDSVDSETNDNCCGNSTSMSSDKTEKQLQESGDGHPVPSKEEKIKIQVTPTFIIIHLLISTYLWSVWGRLIISQRKSNEAEGADVKIGVCPAQTLPSSFLPMNTCLAEEGNLTVIHSRGGVTEGISPNDDEILQIIVSDYRAVLDMLKGQAFTKRSTRIGMLMWDFVSFVCKPILVVLVFVLIVLIKLIETVVQSVFTYFIIGFSFSLIPSITSFFERFTSSRRRLSPRNKLMPKEKPNKTGAGISDFSILSSLKKISLFLEETMGLGFGNLNDRDMENPYVTKSLKLEDYKGANEAKEELSLVIDFLKNPVKYHELGARLPRGILLYGPPGTGKTFFAKVLAGEADVSFIHKCASEFRTMFVGSGARAIRNMFANARKLAPCILFIDEIDSVSKRTTSTRHPYANQAINQILYEMDGFIENDADVIVVAATNRLDNVDEALLRPGRFDKIVHVGLPDFKTRKEILEHQIGQLKKVGYTDAAAVALKTEELSGAELKYLVNEAALLAATAGAEKVEQKHFEEAVEKRKKTREKVKEYNSKLYESTSREIIPRMYN